MELVNTLQKLGLSKKEAEVYLTLLSLGKVTGYQVAKKSALDRSTTYFLLRELRKKGLVLQAPQGSKQFFVAKNPQTFIEEKKQEVVAAESLLPQLMRMTQIGNSPQTLHFEGAVDGSAESLNYILDRSNAEDMVAFVSYTPGGHTQEVGDSIVSLMEKIQKRGIRVRGIAPQHESIGDFIDKHFGRYGWDVRIFSPEQYDMRSSVVVMDQFVRITSRSRDMSVVIENDEIANMARNIFSIVWELAAPLEGR